MTDPEIIIQRLKDVTQHHFANRNYFACVYGSYASGCQTSSSDIDFFVATEDPQKGDLEVLVSLLKGLAQEYDLALDTEVPYENKLLISFVDLERAVSLDAFVMDGTAPVVPVVRKEKDFLESPQIRWRLVLNALTTPHIHIAGNLNLHRKYRLLAERSLRTLSKSLANEASPLQTRVHALLISNEGLEGELFLGYKSERESIVKYLRHILEQGEQDNEIDIIEK